MKEQQFSIIETFKFSWKKFKEKALFFIGIGLLSAVIGSIGEVHNYTEIMGNLETFNRFNLVSCLGFLLSIYLSLGVWKISVMHLRGEDIQLNDLFSVSLEQYINYIIASIICMVAVVLGLVLFLIPGIHIICRLLIMPGYIVDKNQSFDEAIKSSWNDTKGQAMHLFLWLLFSCLIVFAGILALVVGMFIALPLISLALAYVYIQISGKQQQ